MARGPLYTKHMDLTQTKEIYEAPVENWGFIYQASTTKLAEFDIGDRVVLPGGREFVYAKSSAACKSGQACEFTATGFVSGNKSGTPAVGDTSIIIGAATHSAATLNELRGGYIVINYTNGVNQDIQCRGIVGNDVSAENAAITIYMDGPLDTAPSAGTLIEVFQNPYAALRTATSPSLAKAGVPATYVSAASMYFFVQVRGPVFAAPQSTVVNNEGIGVMFRSDGSIEAVATALGATIPDADTTQYAGYVIEGSYSGYGPLFMLQL